MSRQPERLHGLDFLRGLMMFLGILLHGMLSFTEMRVPFWPAHDDERSPAADFFVFVVHDFRMQTFFLLAGFFGALLHERYGLGGMLTHRFMRIVVPFGLALIIIQPILQALWLVGDLSALHHVGVEVDAGASRAELLERQFLSGRFLGAIYPFHLWFLYYLIVFFLMMVPLLAIGARIGSAGERCVATLFGPRGKAFVLAALTAPLVWPMEYWGMVDTPSKWELRPYVVAYYFAFFVAGWLLWRQRDVFQRFCRDWAVSLLLANVAVLPVFIKLVFEALDGRKGERPMPGVGQHVLTCYLGALYTWLMVIGLVGGFQQLVRGERRWVRYLADASYWCYLWHLVPIIALQILLVHVPLPGLVKFAIVIGVSMAILLATYEWCVRYTWIGAMLNGRKFRDQKSAVRSQRPEYVETK